MTFILDASLVLAGVMPDETSERADSLLERLRQERAIVPCVWSLEVANALVIAERRHRISREQSDRIVQVMLELPIEVEVGLPVHDLTVAVNLARDLGLSAYHASYLELARRLGLPLATLDAQLRDGAAAIGVSVL